MVGFAFSNSMDDDVGRAGSGTRDQYIEPSVSTSKGFYFLIG